MADAWAVIAPGGDLAWYPLDAEGEVEALVSGDYAYAGLERALVTGPIRVILSIGALRDQEHGVLNPVGRVVVTALSETRITKALRGYVALVQYDQSAHTGGWLGPAEMGALWRERITKAVVLARGGWGCDCLSGRCQDR
jgi:hypothetical protein